MSAARQAARAAPSFIRLTELVESRLGLGGQVQHDRLLDYLGRRTEAERLALADRLAGLPDFNPPWRELTEALLVHESYFYRHPDQLDVLVRQVLPSLRRHQTAPLRVWCAGCSTGEEAYTLAFLLRDAGCEAMVIGTDLSTAAIEQARLGRYRRRPGLNSFRAMPGQGWRNFVAHPLEQDSWSVNAEIQCRVVFADHNLMVRQPANFVADIICCRNTFIYFGLTGQRRAEATLVAAAHPGTVLLLGPAERLLHTTVFQPLADHPQILRWPLPEQG